MMEAAVIAAPNCLELTRCAIPVPAPGQVRVRVEGSGVCASNLPVWQGRPWFSYPMEPGAPGHEGWGVVEAVTADDAAVRPGDRVAFLSCHAYGEYDVTDAASVVPIPSELGDRPCPGEPFACAVNVLRRARIAPGELVVVVGVGFLGAVIVRLAAMRGARVIALSRRPFALELAHELGAELALPLEASDGIARVLEHTSESLADCVIETAGVQAALDVATTFTRTRGRLVIAGYHQDGLRHVDMQTWNWRGLDVINAHERDPHVYVEGMREALELARDGALNLDRFITHRLPIDGLSDAFGLMHERPDGFLKAVVTFGGAA